MNYLIFNLMLVLGASSLAINHEREITSSLHYIVKNWEGIAETGYRKVFRGAMPSSRDFDKMLKSLSQF